MINEIPLEKYKLLVEDVVSSEEDADRQMALALQKQLDFREQRQQAPQVNHYNLTLIL